MTARFGTRQTGANLGEFMLDEAEDEKFIAPFSTTADLKISAALWLQALTSGCSLSIACRHEDHIRVSRFYLQAHGLRSRLQHVID